MMKRLLVLATLLPAAACTTEAASDWSSRPGLANPASVYCANQGGEVEVRTTPQGQVGYCHLLDGRVVEEWKLFRAAGGQP